MARIPRLSLPNVTQHVLSRGHNRVPTFFTSDDYELYLDIIHEAVDKYGVMLHAYCLMPDHVHLLMTPACHGGISHVMQYVGRRYVRYVNDQYSRHGTIWAGRYHSCLIEDDMVLDCYRFIESNPVRNQLVKKANAYDWSSYRMNTQSETTSKLIPHTSYLDLGRSEQQRYKNYQAFFKLTMPHEKIVQLREATNSNRVYGSDSFIHWLEQELGISIRKKKAGRPRLAVANV